MKHVPIFFKNSEVAYHIIGWLTFIIYEVSFVTLIRWTAADTPVWTGYILPYGINIGLFYFHARVVLPIGFISRKKRISAFLGLLILEMAIYLLLMGLKDWDARNVEGDFFTTLYPTSLKFIQQLWRGIYFLIFATAFWLIRNSFKSEQRLKEAETQALHREQENKALEVQLVSTQNAFLQSQINPHLLFNTLNFIHSEVQQASSKASDAIIVLSNLMRYSLFETKTDGKVLLEKEIEQIDNLVRINQFRFNRQLYIHLHTSGDFSNTFIIPLLMLPFVENLFKYAELSEESQPVQIFVELRDNTLLFRTFNKKRNTANFRTPGIGIENVRKRLAAYYKDRFNLHIDNNPSTYSVDLSISL